MGPILITIIISGIAIGVLYSLIGVALVIIYRTSRVLNFAQADLVTVAAYIMFTLVALMQVSYLVAVAGTLIASVILCVGFYYLVARPLSRTQGGWLRINGLHDEQAVIVVLIGTIAASMVLQGVEPLIWGREVLIYDAPGVPGGIKLLGATVSYNNMIIIGTGVVLLGMLTIFLNYTMIGKSMEAAFDNPVGAELVGIRVDRVYVAAWVISGVIGAVTAILAVPITHLTSTGLVVFLFSAFAAIVIGGFTSIMGAVIGGISFGLVQNLIVLFVSAELPMTIVSIIMIAVLLVRPNGLLGREESGVRV